MNISFDFFCKRSSKYSRSVSKIIHLIVPFFNKIFEMCMRCTVSSVVLSCPAKFSFLSIFAGAGGGNFVLICNFGPQTIWFLKLASKIFIFGKINTV